MQGRSHVSRISGFSLRARRPPLPLTLHPAPQITGRRRRQEALTFRRRTMSLVTSAPAKQFRFLDDFGGLGLRCSADWQSAVSRIGNPLIVRHSNQQPFRRLPIGATAENRSGHRIPPKPSRNHNSSNADTVSQPSSANNPSGIELPDTSTRFAPLKQTGTPALAVSSSRIAQFYRLKSAFQTKVQILSEEVRRRHPHPEI
jgi:hypothetical protein